MLLYLLAICGLVIIGLLALYAFRLVQRLNVQNKLIAQAKQERIKRLKESMVIIAKAMQNGDCSLAEGVLRLTMLLVPFGLSLQQYPAMFALYQAVHDMPTHDDYRALAKQQRMKIDLTRESAEAQFAQEIMLELPHFLSEVEKLGEV